MADKDWKECIKSLKGVVLDMCGVLYDSGEGGGIPIPGSVEAVKRIKASDLQLRWVWPLMMVPVIMFNVFPADLLPEFKDIDNTNPNCVVIGDAADKFSYQNLNDAFRVLIQLEKPVLFSLGRGRYYKETDGLKLDVGVYMKALEYACDVEAEVVGKPAPMFFQSVLTDMGIQPQEALMIGDDLINDVGGAQNCGMRGLQVRTGKYRPGDEKHPAVTADGYVDNLAEAVDIILKYRGQ
ncbi:phospholysine phosphohistidine inorganic pyrophosphate phosphatase [Anguilla rostrata]|uniref:phospholysine phosphohistidine inorganic pyrophosphate phosphatase n=1 Tax=Anguilla rostrata TaxID=7938 RepID=UPI0030D319C2